MSDDNTLRSILAIFPKKPIQWFGAALGFGAVGGVVAGAVMLTGALDLGAVSPHTAGVSRILHGTFQRSTAARAEEVPEGLALDDPSMVLMGAGHYANVCANCHGAPGRGQNPIALSMRPEPPMLLTAAQRYESGELFRILDAGVRLSAMPAWPVGNRPDEVWAMVAFLERLPTMTPLEYERLAHGDNAKAPPLRPAPEADANAAPRPYLPGDPQSLYTVEEATLRPAVGFVDLRARADLASACAGCHGTDGAGREGGAFPNLTLHTPEYIADSLRSFADGSRQSAIMWAVAANLNDDDIAELAALYGEGDPLPSKQVAALSGADAIARGEEIAARGIAENPDAEPDPGQPVEQAVQSCNGCHVIIAKTSPNMPKLAGQNAAYLRNQLRLFRDGGRGNSLPSNPMSSVSHDLEDVDIDALAVYYASLEPTKEVE